MQLAHGVVETPGAGPAVGAAEDGLVAVFTPYARELARDEFQGDVPVHFHERLAAPSLRVCTRATLEDAPA
jgi:hypothetical protein